MELHPQKVLEKYLNSLKPSDIFKKLILMLCVSKNRFSKTDFYNNSTVEQSFKGETTKNFNEIFRNKTVGHHM